MKIDKKMFVVLYAIIVVLAYFNLQDYLKQSFKLMIQPKQNLNKSIIKPKYKVITFKKIIKSQTPNLLSDRVCKFNPSVCQVSKILSKDAMLTTRFYRMFTSVIIYESGNFHFHRNMQLWYVMGFPQINTNVWNLSKIHKLGFHINSLNDLITNPVVAIQISEAILWNNISVAYSRNPNKDAILDYASSYYGVGMPHNYTSKLCGYYYNNKLINKTMKKKFVLTDKQIIRDHMGII